MHILYGMVLERAAVSLKPSWWFEKIRVMERPSSSQKATKGKARKAKQGKVS